MRVSLPYYTVSLFAAFIFGLLSYYLPNFAFTPEQVLWSIVTILTLMGIDVINALLAVAMQLASVIVSLHKKNLL